MRRKLTESCDLCALHSRVATGPVRGVPEGGGHESKVLRAMKRLGLLLVIFLTVFSVHVLSRVKTSYDSRWSVYVAMSIIAEGNTDLDEFDEARRRSDHYAIETISGHKYDVYPVGTPLLAVPFVGAIDLCHRLVRGHGLRESA